MLMLASEMETRGKSLWNVEEKFEIFSTQIHVMRAIESFTPKKCLFLFSLRIRIYLKPIYKLTKAIANAF